MKILGDDVDSSVEVQAPKVKRPRKAVEDRLAELKVTENVEAVHVFSQVGSLAETARRLKISIHELTRWSREPWWQRELQGIQREQTALENVKLTSLWGQTIEQMGQALERGVPIITKNGPLMKANESGELEQVYGPMSPTHLAKFAEVLFNQRQLVREMPTAIVGNNSKLEELADKLSALGHARKEKVIEADVQDVEAEGEEE